MHFRDITFEPLLRNEPFKESLLPVACEKAPSGPRSFPNNRRYWTTAIALHGFIFILVLFIGSLLLQSQPHMYQTSWQKELQTSLVPLNCMSSVDRNKQPEADLLNIGPLRNEIRYKSESLPADYWNNDLFMGEPSLASDIAWRDSILSGWYT